MNKKANWILNLVITAIIFSIVSYFVWGLLSGRSSVDFDDVKSFVKAKTDIVKESVGNIGKEETEKQEEEIVWVEIETPLYHSLYLGIKMERGKKIASEIVNSDCDIICANKNMVHTNKFEERIVSDESSYTSEPQHYKAIFCACLSNQSSDETLITEGKTCPENIIPDRLFLDCKEDYDYMNNDKIYYSCCIPGCINWNEVPIDDLWKWADNSVIISQNYPICHTGYKEGENINYIYCSEMWWSKQEISKEGVILPKEEYEIRLVLDFNDFIEEKHAIYHTLERKNLARMFKKYKIISYSCYR